jgi:hypothetical protein
MPLAVFTIQDRVDLVYFLQLPQWELEESAGSVSTGYGLPTFGSPTGTLYQRLLDVENRDSRLSTQIATSIKASIVKLKAIDVLIESARTSGQSSIQSAKSDYEVAVTYFGDNFREGGGVAGLRKNRKSLIADIRRWLGWNGADSVQLYRNPAPVGHVKPRYVHYPS